MKLKALHVNGLRFTCYVQGSGATLIILLHGFPDDAASMLGLMQQLESEDYTIAAPYLRGYGPTSRAHDGQYMLETLGRDVTGLMDALGHETAIVVGHDWGAMCAYAAANIAPQRIELLIALSVPPPSVFLKGLLSHPSQLQRSAYMMLFQIPGLSEWLLQYQDFALVEYLWRKWSPNWKFSNARLAKVKTTLRYRHTARSALKYYRGLFVDALLDPQRWKESLRIAISPLQVPTLVISGDDDHCISPIMFNTMDDAFVNTWQHINLDNCGHFPQHEALEKLVEIITEAIKSKEDLKKVHSF